MEPQIALLGGEGSEFESVAVGNTGLERPVFFTPVDYETRALRRLETDGSGQDAPHEGGASACPQFSADRRFERTSSLAAGRSAATHANAEGI